MPIPDIVKQLSDIKVDEISLVDRGANQHAKVLISKRHDPDITKGSPTTSGVHHDRPMGDEPKKKRKRFAKDDEDVVIVSDEDELSKADDEDDDLAALLETVAARRKRKRLEEQESQEGLDQELDVEMEGTESEDEEASEEDQGDELGSLLEDGEEDEEQPEDELDEAGEEGDLLGGDEEDDLEGDEELLGEEGLLEEEDEPKPMPGDLPEEVSEYVSELERTVDELERKFKEQSQGEVGKSDTREHEEVAVSDTVTKADDLTDEEVSFLEELSKSLDAGEVDATEAVSKAMEEVGRIQKRAEAAEELAKAEKELRLTREHISKVAEQYPHLPVDPNEFGPVLKAVEDALTEEQYEVLSKALAANEAISKSISDGSVTPFTEIGKRGGSTPASSEVEAQADEMVQKGEAKSQEEAIAKLYSERPELYDEYLRDNESQVR